MSREPWAEWSGWPQDDPPPVIGWTGCVLMLVMSLTLWSLIVLFCLWLADAL